MYTVQHAGTKIKYLTLRNCSGGADILRLTDDTYVLPMGLFRVLDLHPPARDYVMQIHEVILLWILSLHHTRWCWWFDWRISKDGAHLSKFSVYISNIGCRRQPDGIYSLRYFTTSDIVSWKSAISDPTLEFLFSMQNECQLLARPV